MQVNPGTVLKYVAQTHDTFSQNSSDIISAVSGTLHNEGIFVLASGAQFGGVLTQLGTELGSSLTADPFTLTLTVQTDVTGDTYASENDVQSIIDNALWQTVGDIPSSTIVVTSQTQASVQASGAQLPSNSLSDAITNFFKQIGSTVTLIILVVIVAVVALIAYKPGSIRTAAGAFV